MRINRTVFAAQSRSVPNGGAPTFDARDALKRADEARVLVSEITAIAAGAGATGVARTLNAVESLTRLALKNVQTLDVNDPPSPPKLVRQTFEALGATYVKLGQFIASAPSVFPAEYVEEFQKCLDETEPTEFAIIRRTIEKDLGKNIDDVFASIDPVPIASASVAQVHRATLLAGNKEVVVKVLKPGVEDTLQADLSFVLIVSKVLQFLNPELSRTSLVDIVGDIRESMLEETDFRKESANIDAFKRYLEDAGLNSIAKAPYVYKQFSNKRVMVMEYFKGVALTDLEAIRGVSNDPETTLINALNVWFGSVLACESFHADVHAGNLIVCDDGKVGFIDFGIVGRISPSIWGAVQAFFQSTASRDYMGATEGEVDVEKFANDLRAVYEALDAIEPSVVMQEDAYDGTVNAAVSVDQQQVTQLATDLIRAAEENKIRLPKAFGILIKQLIYFDRYVQLLAPDLEVIDDDRVAFVDAVAVDVKPRRIEP
jgi:aarF domain-containing kinase